MAKQEVTRGTRKLFEVYITDTLGNPQDPDSCSVTFIKEGEYSYDSSLGPYTCSKVAGIGYWGANVTTPDTMTLGDWIARFEWKIGAITDHEDFSWTLIDKVRPYLNKKAKAGVAVVG